MSCIPDSRWLLETGKLSDFTIICQGTEIRVHKVVLYAHSCYFEALFNSNMKEAQEGVVTFDDIDPDLMRELIEFFYYGEDASHFDPVDLEICVRIWILADRMQAKHAMREVEKHFLEHSEYYENKPGVVQGSLLDTVFSHTACAESAIGEVFVEAAWFTFTNNDDHEHSVEIATYFIKYKRLAQRMLCWSRNYIQKDIADMLRDSDGRFDNSAWDSLRSSIITKKLTEVPERTIQSS